MRPLSILILTLIAAIAVPLLAACSIPDPVAPPGSGATPTPPPDRVNRSFTAPEQVIDPAKAYIATIKTTKGDIVIQLLPEQAPIMANNFVFLAQRRFYEGLLFHNIVPGSLAQTGDPVGDGSGGPGYELEEDKNTLKNEEGYVSFAKSGGGTKIGSQFFINLAANPSLDADTDRQKRFYPFARVVGGLDIARSLVGTDAITSITISTP